MSDMDEPVRLAIIGCGGMGRRHLAGLAELSRTSHMNCNLVAVCDPNRQNAEDLADEAHELLGGRPVVFGDAERMVRDIDGLEAADCPTDTGSHHVAATQALELGVHILCEKPLALTIRGCKRIIEAARRGGRILSVAENFRRDPMNRLVKALIEDGAIGKPQFMIDTEIGGRDSIIITPWCHIKLSGTITPGCRCTQRGHPAVLPGSGQERLRPGAVVRANSCPTRH
jgi:predicted dehydrogenase